MCVMAADATTDVEHEERDDDDTEAVEATAEMGEPSGLWSWLVRFANNEELGALRLVTRWGRGGDSGSVSVSS